MYDISRCQGCVFNVPSSSGKGNICNGETMLYQGRCPVWVVNRAQREGVTIRQITHPGQSENEQKTLLPRNPFDALREDADRIRRAFRGSNS